MEEVYGFLPVLLLRESDTLAQIKVEEIMTKDIKTIPCDLTVSQFLDLIAKYHHVAYPMVNEKGEPVGIVTLEEASKVEKTKRQATLVSNIARRKLIVAYPGETALDAFKKMEEHEVGRILILDPANPKKLLGMITKTDLMHTLTNNVENT
jgi:CBS domain-containing protein